MGNKKKASTSKRHPVIVFIHDLVWHVKFSHVVFAVSLGVLLALLFSPREQLAIQPFNLLNNPEELSWEPAEAVIQPTIEPKIPPPHPKELSASPPVLSARAVVALDVASKEVLFASNERLQLWPASTTKVMTALVALDAYDLDEEVTVTSPIHEGSVMELTEGEHMTVENLLYGTLIQSANDAAYALAQHHPAGIAGFVDQMNQKVEEIGLENTHFVDPAGFDNEKQYTTAYDLAKLSLYALTNRTIAHMVSLPAITVPDGTFTRFHSLKNVNQLLGTVPGVAGIKTGWTENAKENLINLTKRDGHGVLTVILGSDDRFGETQYLTNWVFENFEWNNSPTP
ncbi:D-alanyl-D-alanine carboxypeptidase [Candidatus Roizmanbacteria bacterium]|nr:D-alanyl-D-alanine carboxypeptidase [Candidatus Roizmanbacteria bacterium]